MYSYSCNLTVLTGIIINIKVFEGDQDNFVVEQHKLQQRLSNKLFILYKEIPTPLVTACAHHIQ